MQQVDLIRGRIFRLLKDLSVYISCLPEHETTALERLAPDCRQKTFTNIASHILTELGAECETKPEDRNNHTRRAAARNGGI